jgi:hypothetical protein
MDDELKFHCLKDRLAFMVTVMGIEGYFPCLKCTKIHELYTKAEVAEYYKNKEDFRRKYPCIFQQLGLV